MTIPAWISLISLETVGNVNSYATTLVREGSRRYVRDFAAKRK